MKTISTQSGTLAKPKNGPVKAAKWPLLVAFLALCGAGFGVLRSRPAPFAPPTTQTLTQATTPVYAQKLGWKVVGVYPHDAKAFTQGLQWFEGGFYEGTGLEGESQLRRLEFPSGRVLQKRDLPKDVFGEGITLAGDKIYQLTWQSHIGYVYDRASFKLLKVSSLILTKAGV